MKTIRKMGKGFSGCLLFFLVILIPQNGFAEKPLAPASIFGKNDAALVTRFKGEAVFSHNPDQKLVPASVLKILTSLSAIHYLSPDHRFITEFYLDEQNNLKIKGMGDPLLISELLPDIAKALFQKVNSVNHIILDASAFSSFHIPGTGRSENPYDAPCGALCINFNTVYYKKTPLGIISAEPQTPLINFAKKRIIKQRTASSDRIIFTHKADEAVLYAGHLMAHFLRAAGIKIKGKITTGKVMPADRYLYRFESPFSLLEIIQKLMEYSNNFIANQLLLAMGAKAYGFPGTREKGVLAMKTYAENNLGIKNLEIVEGSGISRENRISPSQMIRILKAFLPYRHTMRRDGNTWYKTGTLSGIRTRAGYISFGKDNLYLFVIMCNTPGKSAESIEKRIAASLFAREKAIP